LKLTNKQDQNLLLSEYLVTIKDLKNYSDHTVLAYKTDIKQFYNFINISNSLDLEKYIQNLAMENYSKRTLNRKIASLTSFLNWCNKSKKMDIPDNSNFKALKTEKKLPNVMTSNYINSLMNDIPVTTVKEIRDRSIVELLYSSGLRVSELTNLQLPDIKNNMSGTGTRKG